MASQMSMPTIKFSLPPASYFLPPGNVSKALPPPPSTSPFYISPSIYLAFLDIRVPITIAATYAITVHILNSYASSTKPATPYAFAKTKAFHCFVVAHNLLLAVYSGWTFIGIFETLSRTIPGLKGDEGVVGTVHSLCKIREDNGSGLWQEGLAFYGWLFYLSKFYEVVDTAIILAKGRKSSTLQTYHHAGAMASMYLGIRYMSPPIFVFVLFNSFIHTLMYTYYTLSALRIHVPNFLKRGLTTLQISQFIIGGSYAASYLFIKYIPPLNLQEKVGEIANIRQEFVTCLSSSAEVWAVLANVIYLTPLTYLFVMFFIRSYINVGKKPTSAMKKAVEVKKPVIGKTVAA